jgi:hypothetical protein
VRLLALVLGAALLAGCGTEFVADPPREPRPTVLEPQRAVPVADPTGISIPVIGVDTDELTALGLLDGGELDTPPLDRPGLAGWYAGRDPAFPGDEWQPGEDGPAIIVGHVDGYGPDGRKGYPGVFARLSELKPGAEVVVKRDQGQAPVTFVVSGVDRYPKTALPWDQIMAPTSGPTLRLITCGGDFDRGTGHYVDNWVVWAELAP